MSTLPDQEELEKTYIFHQLDEYPWAEDEEFQGGLRAILGSVEDPASTEHLTLRAKCYYFARKAGTSVDFEGYKQWVEDLRTGTAAANGPANTPGTMLGGAWRQGSNVGSAEEGSLGSLGEAPKPASFAEICEMIAANKPIPGIKDIPDTVLEGQATESQATRRKKPWEKQLPDEPAGAPSWLSSASGNHGSLTTDSDAERAVEARASKATEQP
ncbi:hypothetical protein BDY17DRAFT_306034 [Neohortaea acidophila]|uniref:Uncharacterized protein n=1 Tax=Neohortaea acidophila TaxID=245834 RepID=A0A6A6PI21_9PEZI|nr:uncharacterized protein BDY17DRAFT_306034 [Neohortaea acidophila]KAF2478917.1 hypothetical protein BDY17DRAFT_306034 [Neohortaea acidophila]